jgi:hypothetical protein
MLNQPSVACGYRDCSDIYEDILEEDNKEEEKAIGCNKTLL